MTSALKNKDKEAELHLMFIFYWLISATYKHFDVNVCVKWGGCWGESRGDEQAAANHIAHTHATNDDWRKEEGETWAGSHLKAQVGSFLRSRRGVHGAGGMMKIFKKLFLNIIFLLAFTHQQVERVHVENDSLLKTKQRSEEMVEDDGEKLQGGAWKEQKERNNEMLAPGQGQIHLCWVFYIIGSSWDMS